MRSDAPTLSRAGGLVAARILALGEHAADTGTSIRLPARVMMSLFCTIGHLHRIENAKFLSDPSLSF
jgi:hypothetical protein